MERAAAILGATLLLSRLEERSRFYPSSAGRREAAKFVGDISLGALFLLQRDKREGALAVLNALATVHLVKLLTCRRRPEEGRGFRGPLKRFDSSFPSGHAAAAFSMAYLLTKQRPKGKNLWLGLASLVALSRVYRGRHWPTDVVVGALVGLRCGRAALRATRSPSAPPPEDERPLLDLDGPHREVPPTAAWGFYSRPRGAKIWP